MEKLRLYDNYEKSLFVRWPIYVHISENELNKLVNTTYLITYFKQNLANSIFALFCNRLNSYVIERAKYVSIGFQPTEIEGFVKSLENLFIWWWGFEDIVHM